MELSLTAPTRVKLSFLRTVRSSCNSVRFKAALAFDRKSFSGELGSAMWGRPLLLPLPLTSFGGQGGSRFAETTSRSDPVAQATGLQHASPRITDSFNGGRSCDEGVLEDHRLFSRRVLPSRASRHSRRPTTRSETQT